MYRKIARVLLTAGVTAGLITTAAGQASAGFELNIHAEPALTAAPARAPAVDAAPRHKLSHDLAELWTRVLATPTGRNPFGEGGAAFACFDLGGTVAPFAPGGVESCTVKSGTKVFVVASSFECSSFEGNGTSDAALRSCARQNDAPVAPTVTVDGTAVAVSEVETRLLHITLPEDNLFGLAQGSRGVSVAHGWVVLVQPLRPGSHTITISPDITTTIVVTRRP